MTPEFEANLSRRETTEQRVLLWVTALADEFGRREWSTRIPKFELAAFGFLDPDVEMDAFGVTVYATGSAPRPSLTRPTASGIIDHLMIDGYRFPVAVREYDFEPAAVTVHPQNGRSTCWASSRSNGYSGILTALHVVNVYSNPNKIQLQDPTGAIVDGVLRDTGPAGIDAALVEPPYGAPPTQTFLAVEPWPAPWSDVTVYLRHRTIATKITAVTDTRGVLDPALPARIFTARAFVKGDSGSGCSQQSNSAYIGLLMGKVTTRAGVEEGVLQNLGQVESVLDLQMWE
jgi:hypothetical protein